VWRWLRSSWRNLTDRNAVEREIHDEIFTSFESVVEEHVRSGMVPLEARRQAMLEFGGVESVKDRVRDARAGSSFDALRQDVRYAARLLRRNPIFTGVAAVSLAVGIGANTTIFTIANGLLLRPPNGVAAGQQLVDIFRGREGESLANFTTSYPYYRDVRQRAATVADMFAFDLNMKPVSIGSADGTEMAFAMVVTSNYFAVLGVTPAAGRTFESIDDAVVPTVVLSHRYWERRFNANPALVGQTIRINRLPFIVAGVAAKAFRSTNVTAPDLWMPMSAVTVLEPESRRLQSRAMLDLGMGGRLKPGASRMQAAADLDAIALGLEREHPVEDGGVRLRVAALSSVPGPIATVASGLLASLFAVVSAVLLIACANVSGVLLARAAARRREIAVRIAIGAGRARLIRQFLTETIVLFVLGGLFGLALARALTSVLLSVLPAVPIPVDVSIPLDGRVLAFTIGVSSVAALLAGIAPALHAARADVVVALKDESQGPRDRLRLRSTFVVAQVAISITLVVIASLLVQALQRLSAIDQGFDPRGVEFASVDLTAAGYNSASAAAFAEQLVARIRAMSGVDAASLSQWMPGRGGADVALVAAGATPPNGEASFAGTWNAVSPDFFRTLRVSPVAGREFTASDRTGGEAVTILTASSARMLWPGQDPIGRYVTWLDGQRDPAMRRTQLKVVGIVPDLTPRAGGGQTQFRDRRPGGAAMRRPILMMYVPLAQHFTPRLTIFARSDGNRRLAADIRALVKSLDANLPMATPQPLDAQTGPIYFQLRLAATVAGSVGAVGLLLAALGVYGVAAYTAQCRTREFGVRMALGASRADVIRMVMGQGLSLVALGSTFGFALAVAASRLFRALLADVSVFDLRTLGGAALLFMIVGLAACVGPARRATSVDAMDALRYE
jgi:predicted permease